MNWRNALSLPGLCGLLLFGCGGGGGGGGESEAPPATPSSGHYAWVLRGEGPTDAIRFGLSLIHPDQRDTEIVIELPTDAVTDAKVVATAVVDASSLSTGALQPHALVYVVGGDVRRVPLAANGQAPASRVQRAQTSSACRFALDAPDYATPELSRFIVTTAGADGRCDTADDARAEVRLDAALGLVLSPWSGPAPLAVLRDPKTLAPRGWLTGTEMRLWEPAGAVQVVALRPPADPVQRAVLATHRSVLAESAAGMSVFDFEAGSAFSETALPALSGRDWQALGFDATNYYLYRNASGAIFPNWSVARVHRATHGITLLASGVGQIVLASAGRDVLYTSVVNAGTFELRQLQKAVAGATQLLASGPLSQSFFSIVGGADDVHMMWQATGLDGTNPSYRVDIVDETGLVLRSGRPGGFSLGLADAQRIRFDRSESRSRFLFAENYGSRFFSDAMLQSYDGSTRQGIEAGALPGQAEFGADAVFANVVAGPLAPAAGFASRSVGGVLQGEGTRIFTFDPARADSLLLTTRRQ